MSFFEQRKICTYCDGSGTKLVWKNVPCSGCFGVGTIMKQIIDEFPFEIPVNCNNCGGSGQVSATVRESCSLCGGTGYK